MQKRIFLILTCSLLLGTLTGCSGKSQNEDAKQQETENDTAGEPDADTSTVSFEASTMDGENISSDIFGDSRLTMLNVWATYCNPCLNEMPELGELATEYDSADFQLLGIISDVTEDSSEDMLTLAAEMIDQTNAGYPHMLLNESLYYSLLYDVSAVPTTFFINENGEVLDTVIGAMDKVSWKEKIDELLEEL